MSIPTRLMGELCEDFVAVLIIFIFCIHNPSFFHILMYNLSIIVVDSVLIKALTLFASGGIDIKIVFLDKSSELIHFGQECFVWLLINYSWLLLFC